MLRILAHPLIPLVGFSLVSALILAANAMLGVTSPLQADILYRLGWTFLMLSWLGIDVRRLRGTPCFDLGLFFYLAFPLSVIWYCLWSRGWRRGFLLLALFLVFLVIPGFVAELLALANRPERLN